jgi:hypothetical protein
MAEKAFLTTSAEVLPKKVLMSVKVTGPSNASTEQFQLAISVGIKDTFFASEQKQV